MSHGIFFFTFPALCKHNRVVMPAPIHMSCTISPFLASTYICTCMLLCQPNSHNICSTKPLLPTLHASASRSVAQHQHPACKRLCNALHASIHQQAASVSQHGHDACAFRVVLPRHAHATSIQTRVWENKENPSLVHERFPRPKYATSLAGYLAQRCAIHDKVQTMFKILTHKIEKKR